MTSFTKRRKARHNLFGTSALKVKDQTMKRVLHYNSSMRHEIKNQTKESKEA